MASQSQPPIPPTAGLYGSPGSPNSAKSAPSADFGADPGTEQEGVVMIQGTPVIDATGIGTTQNHTESTSAGTQADDVPVDPIPPVSDPADDPVVRAHQSGGATAVGETADSSTDSGDDPVYHSTDSDDGDRLNDPRA